MSYKIMYEPEKRHRYPTAAFPSVRRKGLALLLLLTFTIVILLAFGGSIIEFLIPGDPEVTKSAFGNMLEQIRQGDGVTEAFSSFCREILLSGY